MYNFIKKKRNYSNKFVIIYNNYIKLQIIPRIISNFHQTDKKNVNIRAITV